MSEPARVKPDENQTPGDEVLTDLAQQLVTAVAGLAMSKATASVSGLTGRLSSVAENGGSGLTTALSGARSEGKPTMRAGLGTALGGIKDKITETVGGGARGLMSKVTGALGGGDSDGSDSDDADSDDADSEGGGGGGGGGGGKKLKVTVIVEHHDIGLPLRTTYDLWTQFGDFPGFMKKVESVETPSDEKTNWKAQVFLSHRTWEATIVEQVPDSHIIWQSKGAKGHVDGAVTFTELGRNLTRVLLVMEYYPQGLFEKTGNIWRAVGRRARLEFQHFARHAMTNVILRQEEIEGWRGEIRESEVVKTHEEALVEEEEREDQEWDESEGEDDADAGEDEAAEADEYEDDADADEGEDEAAEADEYEDDADEGEDDAAEADEYEDDADEGEDDAAEAAEVDETEPETPRRSVRGRARRREPVRSGGRAR